MTAENQDHSLPVEAGDGLPEGVPLTAMFGNNGGLHAGFHEADGWRCDDLLCTPVEIMPTGTRDKMRMMEAQIAALSERTPIEGLTVRGWEDPDDGFIETAKVADAMRDHDAGALNSYTEPLVRLSDVEARIAQLERDLTAAIQFIEQEAGFDCDNSTVLNPEPCGSCGSCRARAHLTPKEPT